MVALSTHYVVAWTMYDLTTPKGVEKYLESTPFAASSVVPLTGGFANFCYRITLRAPYHFRGLSSPVKTLVIKHAQPYLALYKDIPFKPERQEFECLALQRVPELVSPSPILQLPKLYHEDRIRRAILMSDCGADSQTLMTVLQSGPLSENMARDIGVALGTFIAQLHIATRNPAPGTPGYTAKAAFAKHDQARALTCSAFYDAVFTTFTAVPPLLSPPLELSRETLAKLKAHVCHAKARIKTGNDVLNMGDFRPGNFLLTFEPALNVSIVDWEVSRSGYAGMDLGHCLVEFHLLRVFHPASRASVDAIVSAFLKTYRTIILGKLDRPDARRFLVEVAHDSATHVGVYLMSMTPRLQWGGPRLTREVVQEGVEYALRSMDGDETWLRGSIVGGLWGSEVGSVA